MEYDPKTLFTWTLTIISLYGAYLNVKKNRIGFLLWAIVDVFWFGYDFYIGEHAQGALFFAYFFLAAWGYLSWSPQERQPQVSEE